MEFSEGERGRTKPLYKTMMRKQYDFSKAKRGPAVRVPNGKTRITIRLDEEVLAWFKKQVHDSEPLEATLRRVLREELRAAK